MYGTRQASAPSQSAAPISSVQAAAGGQGDASLGTGPLAALVVAIVVYVIWAYLAAHERVRESVQPRNIALNLWNLLVIALTVIVSLTLFKIVFMKLAAWHVPGAEHVLALIHAS